MSSEHREKIAQFFAFDHLPPELREVSAPFGVLAQHIIDTLPRNAERTVALRKLLEAKDAAVRAKLTRDPEGPQPELAIGPCGIAGPVALSDGLR